MPVLKMPENVETYKKKQKMSAYRKKRGNVNITEMRGLRLTIVAVEKQYAFNILSVCL